MTSNKRDNSSSIESIKSAQENPAFIENSNRVRWLSTYLVFQTFPPPLHNT
jgi:hypothetical protein